MLKSTQLVYNVIKPTVSLFRLCLVLTIQFIDKINLDLASFSFRALWVSRATASMGAVGDSAPTVFESVGASTHGFWQLFSRMKNHIVFFQH